MQEALDQPPLEYIDDIIKHIFGRQTSTFIMGFGRRESGKTDFAILIMEILYNVGMIETFATNTKIYESPFTIENITSMPDLEVWAQTIPGKKLFLLDEAGKSLRRRTPMAKLNIELLDNLQILRKHKLSIIMLAPADKYIDAASMGSDVLDGYFIKPYFKNPKIGIYHDLIENFHRNLSDIPPTSVKFDTWDVAPFTLKGKNTKPIFSDKHKEILWQWSHGTASQAIGISRKEIRRIAMKFIREILERERTLLPNHVGVIRTTSELPDTT